MGEIEDGIRKMGFDADMAHNLAEIVRITRETAIEECAKIADAFKPGFCGDDKDTDRWDFADQIARCIRGAVGKAKES